MIKTLLAGLSAVVLVAVGTAPATATVMTLTYTGTVYGQSAFDEVGLFGSAGSNLGGLSFVGVFNYDTNLGERTLTSYRDSLTNIDPTSIQAVTSSLTINGVTQFQESPGYFNYGIVTLVTGELSATVERYDNSGYEELLMDSYPGVLPVRLHQNASGPLSSVQNSGHYRFTSVDSAGLSQLETYLILKPTSFTLTGGVNDVGAVPEPASWALMIGGFGLIGVTMRRRPVACAA